MRLSLSETEYATMRDRTRRTDAILADLAALPGVQSIAISTTNPRLSSWNADVLAEGATGAPALTQFVSITPDFFRALRLPLLEGRTFSARDRADAAPVVIVSHSLAQRLWPGQPAVGKRLLLGGPGAPPRTVVGVASDAQYADEPYRAAVYAPYNQLAAAVIAREFHLLVRTTGDPLALARPLQQQIWKQDRNLPIFGVALLRDVVSDEFVLERTGAAIGGALASFGALLAVLGIFGILSYTVTQARFDWGVRLALGASPAGVLATLMRQGTLLVAGGAVLGALGGVLLTGVLQRTLSGLQPMPAIQLLLLPLGLVLLGATACFLPARRAARIPPVILLKE
jgi:hypothetical protein